MVLICDDDEVSNNSVACDEDRVRGALVTTPSPSESLCEGPDRSIRQSKIEPNRRDLSRGYWAVKIGASCKESPAIKILPLGRRDRRTRAAEPKDSCPASSITTQSASNERRLLKLYNCFFFACHNQHMKRTPPLAAHLVYSASIDIVKTGHWRGMVIPFDDMFDLDLVEPGG